MRLWSLHPKYLDAKGLVAAWREGLLAKKVLEGATIGYKKHPQLKRFEENKNPLNAITIYLESILNEAKIRGYRFNEEKLTKYPEKTTKIQVSSGQIDYEWKLLLHKLKNRDEATYYRIVDTVNPQVNELFEVVEGAIAEWEKERYDL